MTYLFIVILVIYVLQIVGYGIGWRKIKQRSQENFYPKVSVIIALRNEEKEVERLLAVLSSQNYPSEKWELLLVNDHSSDNTLLLLQNHAPKNAKIINLIEESGKKSAIAKAVKTTDAEIVLTTDADCSMSENWIRTMVEKFSNPQIILVAGPVCFHPQKGVFAALQTLEFLSLIGSGAGAIGMQNPIMCNGANLAFRRSVFLEANKQINTEIISGDDVFLLHAAKAKHPKSIDFAKQTNAIVFTQPMQNVKLLLNQRKRWASKSSKYQDVASIYVAFLVLFTNLSLLVLLILSTWDKKYLFLFAGFYLIKFLTDVFLLFPTLKFFNRKDLVKWMFPFEFIYSIYIVLVVIFSFTQSFEWKGRIHRK